MLAKTVLAATTLVMASLVALPFAAAAPMPTGAWPTSTGIVTNTGAITVLAGTTFDGKMQTYERSDIVCKGRTEGNTSTAMFVVEANATLKNVIIGKNQMDGVHCDNHDCTLENVWWSDVCEDALSIKGGSATSVTKVIGGGARYADNDVVQHAGTGNVTIDGFYALDIGSLYKSCGTCGAIQRTVSVSNALVVNPTAGLVTVNTNYGDVATLKHIQVKSATPNVKICSKTVGGSSSEPTQSDSGADGAICKYTASDVTINGSTARSSSEEDAPGSVQAASLASVAIAAAPLSVSAPAVALSPAAAFVAPVAAAAPQGGSRNAQLPGRVQAPPSFAGLAPLGQTETRSSDVAADANAAPSFVPQSLSFNAAPVAAAVAAAPEVLAATPVNSFGFRGVRGLRG